MPVATPQQYHAMLNAARQGGYALPAINVSTVSAVNGALKGLSAAGSDGILQILPCAAEFASGDCEQMAEGAIVLAEAAHRLARQHDILVALHTDHCLPEDLDRFLRPLILETQRRRADGRPNLFNSHMFDGSRLPLQENLSIAGGLLEQCAELEIILELEAGVVGGNEIEGDEDQHSGLTTPQELIQVYAELHGRGRFLMAPAFGNQHGSYREGELALEPEVLQRGQEAVKSHFGEHASFDFVFHGGSSTPVSQIREAIGYGVVKMNLDSDTLYAFTRPLTQHLFKHFDEALRLDGSMGTKKAYDPQVYLRKAMDGLSERVVQACDDLLATGRSIVEGYHPAEPEPVRSTPLRTLTSTES